ncbi:MAG TPA: DUF1684 domain-containing protein [Steroidobacteraceae bacterium]|jgi:hypothetical protein|nr:DUF1684 domain-containing protein [Steroidobacteraceae bacterium]
MRPPLACRALTLTVALSAATAACAAGAGGANVNLAAERASVEAWRADRLHRLTSDTGWLTLAGLFWLKEGENSFGRAKSNSLVLDSPSLPDTAGAFVLHDAKVRFVAAAGARVTHEGQAVSSLDLVPDTAGEPTVLASGSLRVFVIERAGNLGVRVRDLENPHRRDFRGLSYFPVSTDWLFDARFEPYVPAHHLKIVNILGMEEDAVSPGAVVFTTKGREWRLDTVLESPADKELFIMFADETSGHETYGAGRFLYIPLPSGDRAQLDFNKAYNPPCALNDFATCPLPPPQNRLKLRIEAGEKKYAGGSTHHT